MYLTRDTTEAAGTAGPVSGPSAGLYPQAGSGMVLCLLWPRWGGCWRGHVDSV